MLNFANTLCVVILLLRSRLNMGFCSWSLSKSSRYQTRFQYNLFMKSDDADPTFDGKEFEEALKKMGTVVGNQMASSEASDVINEMRKEQLFRKYPFEDSPIGLPVLPDCNNYYSGKFGNYTWHQNADQVFVYIPILSDMKKNDIFVKFETLSVTIKINEEELIKFPTIERIIPDGSFWIFETDKEGNKYLQLDLEKRLRMINWKNLFDEPPPELQGESEKRKKMLESLFAANKGMAKITGKDPETIKEMMENRDLMNMINSEVNEEPELLNDDEGYDFSTSKDIVSSESEDENEADPYNVKKIVKDAADKYFGSNSKVVDTTAKEGDKL